MEPTTRKGEDMSHYKYTYKSILQEDREDALLQEKLRSRRVERRKRLCIWFSSATLSCIVVAIITYAVFNRSDGSCAWSDSDNMKARKLHPMGIYLKGAVASDHPNCSTVGWNMLGRGGSAIDAMIATQLCIGVLHTHSAGLGGGSMSVFYNKTEKKAYAIDAKEVAPFSANSSMFDGNYPLSRQGGLAMAVPGELAGMWTAHQRFGVLPWIDLFQPAIGFAKDGFTIDASLAHGIDGFREEILTDSGPDMRDIFYDEETGNIKQAGDTVKMIKYAKTLKKISESNDPVNLFYKSGQIASDILAEIAQNGLLETRDMNGKRVS